MPRIVIALALLYLGTMRAAKYIWLIRAHGYWNAGETGMRWFLVLELLAAIGFVASGVALLAGWAIVAVRVFVGAGSLTLLVSVLSMPWVNITGWLLKPWLPIFWGLMIVMVAFVLTITLGVMWLEPQVAIWFSR